MTSEETALPFPDFCRFTAAPDELRKKRHCRVLILGNINSGATGIDLTLNGQQSFLSKTNIKIRRC
jgi:hypothetical protein